MRQDLKLEESFLSNKELSKKLVTENGKIIKNICCKFVGLVEMFALNFLKEELPFYLLESWENWQT